jgi:carbon monoxide dehydrogenase subunit G
LIAPPDAGSRPGDAELREFFAGRAAEIFRTVASEAVEKVMWEMTDRLAAEFSAKLRESVEAVAWEVIPSTAEALIREEIARIRGQAGKPSP